MWIMEPSPNIMAHTRNFCTRRFFCKRITPASTPPSRKSEKKLEDFIERNRAGRKSKMARGRQKQLDRMERLEAPGQSELTPEFRFKCLPLTNTEHLSVCQLAVGYDFPLLSDITFRIRGGQKIVLTGFNGIGKSTSLKTLLGQLPALGGTSHFSSQVTPGYFEQNLHWNCPGRTPLQIVSNAFPRIGFQSSPHAARTMRHSAQTGSAAHRNTERR